jgi:hypothetical protein
MATAKPKKPRALDIGRVLKAVDNKNYDYYSSLTEAELKEFSPYVLMRFVSNTHHPDRDIKEWYIIETNERVNKHHWTFSKKHEALIWKLFAGVGAGIEVNHVFMPMLKGSLDKFEKLIEELNPTMKNDEIKLLAKLMTDDDRKELFDAMGFDKKQRKEYE